MTSATFDHNVKRPDVCLYHANCDDGFAAAYAVWRRWGEAVQFIPCQHGETPYVSQVAGKDVLIVDFSYKKDTMKVLGETAKRIVVLDHHVSAQEELKDFKSLSEPDWTMLRASDAVVVEHTSGVGVHFDMNKSGCRLAWEYCFGYEAMPNWFACVEDRDLWRFKYTHTKPVSAAIRSYPRDFEVWDDFDLTFLVSEGKAIRRYMDMVTNSIADQAVERYVCGHKVPSVYSVYEFTSDVGHELLRRNPDAPFVAIMVQAHGGVAYSLRSTDDRMDVSKLAVAVGGGGHRNAAGFRSERAL